MGQKQHEVVMVESSKEKPKTELYRDDSDLLNQIPDRVKLAEWIQQMQATINHNENYVTPKAMMKTEPETNKPSCESQTSENQGLDISLSKSDEHLVGKVSCKSPTSERPIASLNLSGKNIHVTGSYHKARKKNTATSTKVNPRFKALYDVKRLNIFDLLHVCLILEIKYLNILMRFRYWL